MKYLLTMAVAFMLTACASLGVPPADTFNKRAAAAYTSIDTVAAGAAAALQAGQLSKSDAENVSATAKTGLAALKVATDLQLAACPPGPDGKQVVGCSAPLAEQKLSATLAILTALQGYLATKGVK